MSQPSVSISPNLAMPRMPKLCPELDLESGIDAAAAAKWQSILPFTRPSEQEWTKAAPLTARGLCREETAMARKAPAGQAKCRMGTIAGVVSLLLFVTAVLLLLLVPGKAPSKGGEDREHIERAQREPFLEADGLVRCTFSPYQAFSCGCCYVSICTVRTCFPRYNTCVTRKCVFIPFFMLQESGLHQ